MQLKKGESAKKILPGLALRMLELRLAHRGRRGAAGFARDVGIPAPSYYHYENGTTPSAAVLLKVIEKTGCNPAWLVLGEGKRSDPTGGRLSKTILDYLRFAELGARDVIQCGLQVLNALAAEYRSRALKKGLPVEGHPAGHGLFERGIAMSEAMLAIHSRSQIRFGGSDGELREKRAQKAKVEIMRRLTRGELQELAQFVLSGKTDVRGGPSKQAASPSVEVKSSQNARMGPVASSSDEGLAEALMRTYKEEAERYKVLCERLLDVIDILRARLTRVQSTTQPLGNERGRVRKKTRGESSGAAKGKRRKRKGGEPS